jgi:GNAT superfamily N-acetyltransferase
MTASMITVTTVATTTIAIATIAAIQHWVVIRQVAIVVIIVIDNYNLLLLNHLTRFSHIKDHQHHDHYHQQTNEPPHILLNQQRMIRPLSQTDYAAAKRMFHDAFDQGEDPYFVEAWRHRSSTSRGAWVSGVLVGVGLVANSMLRYIYIDQDYRGSGIGTQLLQSVMEANPNLHLIPVDEPEIIRWYEKHGFKLSRRDGSRRVYVRHRHALRNKRIE